MVLIFYEALIYDTNICYNNIHFFLQKQINQPKNISSMNDT